MRGWSDQGPYPLKSIETSGRVDDIALIDRLISLLSSPKPWLELPLFNYVVVPKPFLPEPDPLPDELLAPAPEIDPILLAPLEEDAFEQLLRELVEQGRELDEAMPPEGEFRISLTSDEGLTILERILIILKNENDYSCIRLSSGWCHLNPHFGFQPFRIEDLNFIRVLSPSPRSSQEEEKKEDYHDYQRNNKIPSTGDEVEETRSSSGPGTSLKLFDIAVVI